MFRLLGFELYKMYNRPRSYVAFFGFLLICFFVVLAARYSGFDAIIEHSSMAEGLVGTPLNAAFMAWSMLGSPFAIMSITMMLPIFVCLIFGEIHAGENADGTLRAMLAGPVTRGQVFTSKIVASLLYTVALVAFLGGIAYVLGWAAFGRGGLLALGTFEDPMIAWYSEGEATGKLVLGYALTVAPAITVGSIAYFISICFGNAIGAIGGAIMLMIVMGIVGVLPLPFAEAARPYFFSSYLLIGRQAFLDPINWKEIAQGLAVLGGYTVLSLGASLVVLRRKDIHA